MGGDARVVVWRRAIDREAQARRWRKLGLFYAVPVAIALCAGLLLGGTGAFLGLLILLGLFGLLLVAWIALIGHNARMNPEIVLDDGALVLGRRRVRIDEVEAWTTVMTKASTSVGAPNRMSHSFWLAKALFRVPVVRDGRRATRPDGEPAFEVVAFVWPSMSDAALDTVRVALEPHLPGPWLPPDAFRAEAVA